MLVLVAGLAAGAQAQVIYSWPGANPWYYTVPPVAGLQTYSPPTPGPDFYIFGYGVPQSYTPAVPYAYPYSPYGLQPYAYGYSPYYYAPFPYGYRPVWPYPYLYRYRFHRLRPDDRWGNPGYRGRRPTAPQEPMTRLRDIR